MPFWRSLSLLIISCDWVLDGGKERRPRGRGILFVSWIFLFLFSFPFFLFFSLLLAWVVCGRLCSCWRWLLVVVAVVLVVVVVEVVCLAG